MNARYFFIPSLIVIILLNGLTLNARNRGIKFERLSWEHGMSQSQVNCIYQDRLGYVWVGTNNGLNRYDAYSFTTFNHDPKKSSSISNNRVMAICEDGAGRLWIGTWGGGLNIYDPVSESFRAFRHDPADENSLSGNEITRMMLDSRGVLWIGTWGGGLNAYETGINSFRRYRHNPQDSTTISSNNIGALYEDVSGRLWIGTWGRGLNSFDRSNERFRMWPQNAGVTNNVRANIITSIAAADSGQFWVGTEAGLHLFDAATGRFMQQAAYTVARAAGLGCDSVRTLFQDGRNGLWVGTWGGGIALKRMGRNMFRQYRHNPNEKTSLSNNKVSAIMRDRSGILWVGTQDGLNVYDSRKQKFDHYRPPATGPSPEGNIVSNTFVQQGRTLWVGSWGGLNRYTWENEQWEWREVYSSHNTNMDDIDVRSVLLDSRGILWLGTAKGGLNTFDPAKGSFNQYLPAPEQRTVPENDIRVLFEDSRNRLWVGSSGGGLYLFNRGANTFTAFSHHPDSANSISDNYISAICEEPGRALWIGTLGGGLNRYDFATGEFWSFRHSPGENGSLSNNTINALLLDSSATLWIATDGGGLNMLKVGEAAKGKAVFKRFTAHDGLVNNRIYGICADSSGSLWLSADQGISVFNPRFDKFRNYNVNDGLQGNEFNPGAFYRAQSGQIFFGGSNGFNAFFPSDISDNSFMPPVVISSFKLFYNEQPLRIRSRDGDTLVYEDIELMYDENFFSFEFVALNYTNSAANMYEYRLDGVDATWSLPSTDRKVNYTDLRGGTYTFRVRASNNDGKWNYNGARIKIIITPAFYETTWFKILIGLILLTLVVGGFYLRLRLITRQKEKLERQVEERTRELKEEKELVEEQKIEMEAQRDELKATNERLENINRELHRTQDQLVQSEKMAHLGELTAGIAHEIQNPLNFVNNFAEVSVDLCAELKEELTNTVNGQSVDKETIEELLADLSENMRRIHQHGQRANGIVKGILEHSRVASGDFDIGDINILLEEAAKLAYHGFRAKDNSIAITIDMALDHTIKPLMIIPQDLNRVFINIINNACYALRQKARESGSDFKPSITLATRDDGDSVEIRVRDNGPGIPPDKKDKIFNPFFTTKPSGEGTGLGLSITYDIITKAHQGTVRVESREGEYAEFIVRLPKKR